MAVPASGNVGSFGAKSLAELRASVRRRADMPLGDDASGNPREIVGDEELNEYINESLRELYDILITHYGEDYFVAPAWEFTADGSNNEFALPVDFMKLLGVDVRIQGGSPEAWARVEQFAMAERNGGAFYAATHAACCRHVAGVRYRVRDSRIWFEPAPAAGAVFRLHYIPLMPLLVDSATIAPGAEGDGTHGTLVINDSSVSSSSFDVESLYGHVETALGSVADVSANLDSGVVTVVPASPECVVSWYCASPPGGPILVFSPADTTWSGYTNSRVSHWLEYVIVDCTIKCKSKEESDVGLEMAQKAALLQRIETAASNRDATGQRSVADVRGLGWPFGGDGWSGGW